MPLKLFNGSQILVQDKIRFQRVLNSWYKVPKQSWRLLYRASTHGFSAEAFHRHCDGIAPLFVIVLVSTPVNEKNIFSIFSNLNFIKKLIKKKLKTINFISGCPR